MCNRIYLSLILAIMLVIPFTSANLIFKFGDTESGTSSTIVYNQTAVNVSNFWDNLDTPSNIVGSVFWSNHSKWIEDVYGKWFYNQTAAGVAYVDSWINTTTNNYTNYVNNSLSNKYSWSWTNQSQWIIDTFGKWFYNMTGNYQYNQTQPAIDWAISNNDSWTSTYNDTYANYAYNQSLSPTITIWLYNQTGDYNYNESLWLNSTYGQYWLNQSKWIVDTYGKWFYNMTETSIYDDSWINTTTNNYTNYVNNSLVSKYGMFWYNMTDGFGNYNYNESLWLIDKYGMWWYNMTIDNINHTQIVYSLWGQWFNNQSEYADLVANENNASWSSTYNSSYATHTDVINNATNAYNDGWINSTTNNYTNYVNNSLASKYSWTWINQTLDVVNVYGIWFYNQSDGSYNETYAGLINNASYLSTYNSSYATHTDVINNASAGYDDSWINTTTGNYTNYVNNSLVSKYLQYWTNHTLNVFNIWGKWFYNQSTYADIVASNNNASWTSTYNSSYATHQDVINNASVGYTDTWINSTTSNYTNYVNNSLSSKYIWTWINWTTAFNWTKENPFLYNQTTPAITYVDNKQFINATNVAYTNKTNNFTQDQSIASGKKLCLDGGDCAKYIVYNGSNIIIQS